MAVAQMPIDLHRQGAAILVAEPAAYRRDVHAGFNATGRKQMSQVVMRKTRNVQFLASRVYRALTFVDEHHRLAQKFFRAAFP